MSYERRASASKRIAFVLSSLKFGGGERVALNLANVLSTKGYEIDILLMSCEGEFLAEAQQRFNVLDLRCSRTWMLPGKLAVYLWRYRPEGLISSFWKLNLCACLARMTYPRMHLLLWEHSSPSKSTNSPTWLYASTASLFYRLSTKVIAVSNGVLEDIARITVGLQGKLQVIFNPIPAPVIKSKQRPDLEGKQIVWVGRMDVPKNPGLMLEAFALLPPAQGYTLDFIGDGSLRPALEQRAAVLGLQGQVHFQGYQANPYAWIAQSDILVLSSEREGLPTVLIEALYCGVRVVSTDCGGGIHDILLDNRYGAIVPTGDVSALASAIANSLEKTCDRTHQVEGARRFLPDVIAQQFLVAMGRNPSGAVQDY
jgi:glycosyltransferase involved in cell wall biosynthesis